MDKDNKTPHPPLQRQPPSPTSQPVSQPLTTLPITTHIPHSTHQPFPPTTPTTPTNNSPPSSSSHRWKRSKVVPIGPLPPSTATTIPSPRPYTRAPDPVVPIEGISCTECPRVFWSWKALFGHMRCHPEREWRGINPPPHLRRPPPPHLHRSPPPPPPSEDDREVASSLLLLASSYVSGSHTDDRTNVAKALTRFECSVCKKTFPTHQALGGHRASHKNVKGCFAITKCGAEGDGNSNVIMEGYNSNFTGNTEQLVLSRSGLGPGSGPDHVHRCGICSIVFPSAHALGGHMRCHGEKTEEPSMSSVRPGFQLVEAQAQYGFDLNQPAEATEEEEGSPVGSTSSNKSVKLDLRLGFDNMK